MARLTSAEYAKTHGAKAAKELHAEREARTSKINRRIAEKRMAEKRSFPKSLPGMLMGIGTQGGRLSHPKSRGDWLKVFKMAIPPNESSKPETPFKGMSDSYNPDKGSDFKGWSKYRRVNINDGYVNPLPDSGKTVNGWQANKDYNRVTSGKKINEHYTSPDDGAYDIVRHAIKLASKKLGY